MEAVGKAADAPAPPTIRQRAVQDDVHATSAQPGALVELVVGWPRRLDVDDQLEARTLRRRPARRQRQQHCFGNASVAHQFRAGEDANGERRPTRRRRDDGDDSLGAADERQQDAAVENAEPSSAPRTAAEREAQSDGDHAHALGLHGQGCDQHGCRSQSRGRQRRAPHHGSGDAEAERA